MASAAGVMPGSLERRPAHAEARHATDGAQRRNLDCRLQGSADHHADEKVVPEEQKRESYGEKNVLCSLSSRCLWPEVAFLNVSLNFDATIDKKFPRVCRTTLLSRKDISFVAGTIFFCLLHVKIVTFSFLNLV